MSDDPELQRLRQQLADQAAALLRYQNTTLDEYLRHCHEHLFNALRVRAAPRTPASQSTSSVVGKYYPLKLRPWANFISTQHSFFDKIHSILCDDRLLPSLPQVEGFADLITSQVVACEADLAIFERIALERPVETILDAFVSRCQFHQAMTEFMNVKVGFRTVIDGLVQDNIDNSDGLTTASTPLREQQPRMGVPDRFLVRFDPSDTSGAYTSLFPVEFKAAHKITVEDFERALQKEDLFSRVLCGVAGDKVSTGADRDDDRAEERVAKALSQIFHYMVLGRASFGYLTAGRSLIFLRIGEDAKVLYHHMIHPDINANGETVDPFFTGIAQLSAFCLQTIGDPGKSEEWLVQQRLCLQTWPKLYSEMAVPSANLASSSPTAAETASYVPSMPSSEPDETRSPPAKRTRTSCKEKNSTGAPSPPRDTDSDGSDHEGQFDGSIPESSATMTSKTANTRKQETNSAYPAGINGSSFSLETVQYCTQECLLGLRRRGLLDQKCPNVALHRNDEGDNYHRIDNSEFIQLLQSQMSRPCDRYRYCKPVKGKYGARGQLFKISLLTYGYTFVGKGTFAAAVPSIEREERIYSHLNTLQGRTIPVCLGSINLQTPYPLMTSIVVHMLLLSWGGEVMVADEHMGKQYTPIRKLLYQHGVIHDDIRHLNLLWNEERRSVMVIDFDIARIIPPAEHRQVARLSRKRKRKVHDVGDSSKRAAPFAEARCS